MFRTLLAGLSLALAAPPPAEKPPDLFPLAKGNRWEYQHSGGGTDLGITVVVVKSRTRDGKTEATVSATVEGQGTDDTEGLSADASGVYRTFAGGVVPERPVPVIKYPARPGTSWSDKYKSGGLEADVSFTIKEAEKVTVPAGTYDKAVPVAATVEVGGGKTTITRWHVDGVGMVKQEVTAGPDTITTRVLKKFTPGK
jgi:hypothetical protein